MTDKETIYDMVTENIWEKQTHTDRKLNTDTQTEEKSSNVYRKKKNYQLKFG